MSWMMSYGVDSPSLVVLREQVAHRRDFREGVTVNIRCIVIENVGIVLKNVSLGMRWFY